MSVAIKGLLLSLGVTVLVTSQVSWAYRLPYPCPAEKKHHLPYRVDVPAKETYIKVLTPIEPAPLGPLPPPPPPPPSPPPLYDCDDDVYNNYKHHGSNYGHVALGSSGPLPPPPPPPSSPTPLYDCDEDVYDNYKHHGRVYEHVADQYKEPRPGYLQKYVLYNEEQC